MMVLDINDDLPKWLGHKDQSVVGPENSRRLIMLKIFFRTAILRPYELPFIFRDQFSDERVALPTFPSA